jgi:hypothetical protein
LPIVATIYSMASGNWRSILSQPLPAARPSISDAT